MTVDVDIAVLDAPPAKVSNTGDSAAMRRQILNPERFRVFSGRRLVGLDNPPHALTRAVEPAFIRHKTGQAREIFVDGKKKCVFAALLPRARFSDSLSAPNFFASRTLAKRRFLLSMKAILQAESNLKRIEPMPNETDPPLIQKLQPRGFLSFGPDFQGIELRALNLIIGPNGSGKSNLIEAVALMRAAPKDWRDVTRKGGGVGEWIWKGAKDGVASVAMTFMDDGAKIPIVHEMRFRELSGRFDLVEEIIHDQEQSGGMGEGYYSTAFGHGGPIVARTTPSGDQQWGEAPNIPGQSILSQLRDPHHYPALTWLGQNYEKIRIYRDWAFGRNTVFRNPQQADMRRNVLEEDFSNLGLFLSRIKSEFPATKRAILKALEDLYEGITDFEVNTNGGTVQVFLHEGDFAIPATRLSDGTLRYLCLLAILCDPEPPPLICIEEPELGLHPDILPNLADLLLKASERTQLIVTTHSDILIDAMTETPENVVLCEKHEGKTEMHRLQADDLKVWLDKYRLGQLWIQGQLGGTRW